MQTFKEGDIVQFFVGYVLFTGEVTEVQDSGFHKHKLLMVKTTEHGTHLIPSTNVTLVEK